MIIDHKKRADDMHRRAQAAEGELMRMKAAHIDAINILTKPYRRTDWTDYHLYGFYLMHAYPSLFPKAFKK